MGSDLSFDVSLEVSEGGGLALEDVGDRTRRTGRYIHVVLVVFGCRQHRSFHVLDFRGMEFLLFHHVSGL